MHRRVPVQILLLLLTLLYPFFGASQWVEFSEVTNEWLSLSPDAEEKDIATADFDQNGWNDIVVARKKPFSNFGPRTDLLLMNTGTALEDQTALYAPEFISNPTDARDVTVFDFDGDGWVDIVMANTFEDQPDFYHNLGEDGFGNWLGFALENERFPLPLDVAPLQFCALWPGDINGDSYPDLYLNNYGQGGLSEDVLLINDGNGYFTDESDARLGNLRNSGFGTSVEIHDMDNDGDQDIIKISTLYGVPPYNDNGVYLLFNDGNGNFENWHFILSQSPYMFTVGDLNRDGWNDLYVVDDSQDYINYAADLIFPDLFVEYDQVTVSDPRTTGFGGNVKLVDLDNDGDLDVGVADADVDIPPCDSGGSSRKFTMSRNDGDSFTPVYGNNYFPWNESTYDFAFVDLNNDCYPDLFIGGCEGYRVFLNDANIEADMVSLDYDTVLCPDEEILLEVAPGFVAYAWSDGSSGRELLVSEAGTYCVTVTNSIGCTEEACITMEDSFLDPEIIGETHLCEGPGESTVLTVSGGPYLSYLWSDGSDSDHLIVTEAGNFCVLVENQDACAKEVCATVDVLPEYEQEVTASICFGDSLEFGGGLYWEQGLYQLDLLTQAGCDSTVILDLEVLPSYEEQYAASICFGDSLEFGGGLYWEQGLYQLDLLTQAGCDSTVILDLEVLPSYEEEYAASICFGDSLEFGGGLYWEPGLYQLDLLTQAGCDSTVILDLEVLPSYEEQYAASICFGDSLEFGGGLYWEQGLYQLDLLTQAGCDSTVILDLEVLAEVQLDSFSVLPDNGTGSGSIEVFFSGGIPPYAILWNGEPGGPLLENLPAGEYELHLEDSFGCIITQTFTVELVNSLAAKTFESAELLVMPNPFRDYVEVIISNPKPGDQLFLFDARGQRITMGIQPNGFIDMSELPAGPYWLALERAGRIRAVERIIRIH